MCRDGSWVVAGCLDGNWSALIMQVPYSHSLHACCKQGIFQLPLELLRLRLHVVAPLTQHEAQELVALVPP